MALITVKFIKEPHTGLCAAHLPDGMMLFVDRNGNRHFFTNPGAPGRFGHNVEELQISNNATLDDIYNAVKNGKGR